MAKVFWIGGKDQEWVSRRRGWFLTPYLHWREEAPYWKRHCSSASYTCPGATVGYRKSRFRGSLSRHVPRPELSKKQTYNRIVSYTKEALCLWGGRQTYKCQGWIIKRAPSLLDPNMSHVIRPQNCQCRKLVGDLNWQVVIGDIKHQHLLIWGSAEAWAETFHQRQRGAIGLP